MSHMLIFGLGYSACAVAKALLDKGWTVTGTIRERENAGRFRAQGIEILHFDGTAPCDAVRAALARASHILVSVPPDDKGDPVARLHGGDIRAQAGHLEWIGYFSSLAVYGNRDGGWVDETSDPAPSTARGERRVEGERDWCDLAAATAIPLSIYRLAGIYGPGRSAIDTLKAGTARRIVKPGQVFNRIHVDDIVRTVSTDIARTPSGVTIFNVCDDEPAPPQNVVAFAASLLGMEPPPETPIEDAGLSPMGMSFYSENKRVRNNRVKDQLGVQLAHPDYRAGLKAIFQHSRD